MAGAKTCVKLLLFSFNAVFMLAGFAAVGSGLWMLFDPGRFDIFFGEYRFMYPAAILIASGLFVLLVAFCGCCGAVKENRCLLGTFFTMLVLIFCAEVAAGILGFLFKKEIKNEIKRKSNGIIKMKYGTGDRKLDNAVDLLQEKLKCCGAETWEDYRDSQWIESHPEPRKKWVPESCCSDPSYCTKETNQAIVYKRGCNDQLDALALKDLTILGGIGVGLASIQLIGMCFSCCLFFAIED